MDVNLERYISQMKYVCGRGMEPPKDISPRSFLASMNGLLERMSMIYDNSKEFVSQRKKLAQHIEKYAQHHNIENKEKEPCGADRR